MAEVRENYGQNIGVAIYGFQHLQVCGVGSGVGSGGGRGGGGSVPTRPHTSTPL